MTDEPKLLDCPFCNGQPYCNHGIVMCFSSACPLSDMTFSVDQWNTRAVPQPPQEPTPEAVEAAAWTKTTDRLPEKPGVGSYEHVECLIVIRGEVKFALWNCEHLCWDDNDGDDFLYHPTEPTHWMPRPAPPRAALIAARKARA